MVSLAIARRDLLLLPEHLFLWETVLDVDLLTLALGCDFLTDKFFNFIISAGGIGVFSGKMSGLIAGI